MESMAAIERARLLISQGRFDMAQELLHQALAKDPDIAQAHSWLALCLAQDRDKLKEATREAEQGVHLAPDDSFTHFVLASVWEDRNQIDKALAAIEEAIALDPVSASYYGTKSQLLSQKNNWTGALEAAEEGLTFDPEDESCSALRTVALERLGKVGDAREQAEESLRQNPDSTWAHSAHGWAMLQLGDYQAAQKSFAEALRLSPNNEMARSGMIQALNSSNFVYRWFYQSMIKVSRWSSSSQWILFIGLWLGMRFLNTLAKQNPGLEPWVLPITLLYLLFVMMSWIMVPLFNTMLRFHPFGKHLLSNKEKWASNLIAVILAISVALGIATVIGQGDWIDLFVPILTGLYLTIPVMVPFNCDAPWAMRVGIVAASFFVLLFLAINVPPLFGIYLLFFLIPIYMFGILIYCFVGQFLMKVEAKC